MSSWFVDASVFLAAEDRDDASFAAATRLFVGSEPLATLDLAFYEVANVALRSWRDEGAARRLGSRIAAVADDGGVVRASESLLSLAFGIAAEHGISVYDAAYVAAARESGGTLVSCDVRDLVSRGLACLPGDATRATWP